MQASSIAFIYVLLDFETYRSRGFCEEQLLAGYQLSDIAGMPKATRRSNVVVSNLSPNSRSRLGRQFMDQLWPVVPKNRIRTDSRGEAESAHPPGRLLAILHLLGTFVVNLFRSRRRIEVENLFLRHQLNIALRRTTPSAAAWQ